MAKLIKALVVLALLAGGVIVALRFAGGSTSDAPAAQPAPAAQGQQKDQKKEGMQVQEKYGFAPVEGGGG